MDHYIFLSNLNTVIYEVAHNTAVWSISCSNTNPFPTSVTLPLSMSPVSHPNPKPAPLSGTKYLFIYLHYIGFCSIHENKIIFELIILFAVYIVAGMDGVVHACWISEVTHINSSILSVLLIVLVVHISISHHPAPYMPVHLAGTK